jgi:hypothetical protein
VSRKSAIFYGETGARPSCYESEGRLFESAERAHGWARLPLDAARQQERDDDGQHPVKGEAI